MMQPLTPPSLESAYDVALAAEQRREPAPGYRVYWMAPSRFGSFDVPIAPGSFVVVGRHGLCDVALDADPSMALRHLLVKATRLDDGCPRLSVLDLRTNLGFTLANGRIERSIAVNGAVAFHVGAYAFVALPGGERLPPVLPQPRNPYRSPQHAVSRITSSQSVIELDESSTNVGPHTITLIGHRGAAQVRISAADLERGVLVGRAPKCLPALREVLNDGISRVHVLIHENTLYDVSSTQGTWAFGRRIRAVKLVNGAQFHLGSTAAALRMQWQA